MSDKQAHLEMIQGVVNRLSHNSFLLKGWTVVIVSAMFALSAKDANPLFVYLAYFPAFVFWFLDGYFLRQERLFRKLYNCVRLKEEDTDFSMDVSKVRDQVASWFAVSFSKTLLLFHGAIVITIALVMIMILVMPFREC